MSDLKGKRVGTAFGTVAQFYLSRLLELNGLRTQDVTIVDLKTPAEWVNAVIDGDIDAVVTAQADAKAVNDRLEIWPITPFMSKAFDLTHRERV